MLLRSAALIAVASALSACAGMSEQACMSTDWETVGFEDGTAGRPVGGIGGYRQACGKHGLTPDLNAYRTGHAEGVEIYCRSGNGFEVGRRGSNYQGVCPGDLEPDFLDAYNSGRHLFELESALRNVDSRIANNNREKEGIKKELAVITAATISSETTTEERLLLVTRAAELGARHGELSNENEELERERVVHERELLEYRETLAFGF